MLGTKDILEQIKQHDKLSIRVSSQANNNLPEEILKKLLKPHRKAVFFFAFVEKGSLTHKVDLHDLTVTDGQLFFVLPNQIHTASAKKDDLEFFKMSFDQHCLSLLPKQYLFLINPLVSQIISFDSDAVQRVKMLFGMLDSILHADNKQKDAEIILAHLNSLLTEFNNAYFKNARENTQSGKFSKFIEFKIAVETHLTEQHSVNTIAGNLSVTTNNLYNLVKEFSGLSPKEFIINRLILEAQRKLHYSRPSIKELTYELGFSDPDYFSRLFKKTTGKSITAYVEDTQDLSGK